jgi:hypothetical protein
MYTVEWKRASGVVIRKPDQEDYIKLNAYRTMSLFIWIGKVVENVASEPLSEEAERSGLLSDRQCRIRQEKSAIDEAAIMVDQAQAARTTSYIPCVLLMDIKPAFPSVAKRKASQVDDCEANGWSPYTIDRALALSKNGGDDMQ